MPFPTVLDTHSQGTQRRLGCVTSIAERIETMATQLMRQPTGLGASRAARQTPARSVLSSRPALRAAPLASKGEKIGGVIPDNQSWLTRVPLSLPAAGGGGGVFRRRRRRSRFDAAPRRRRPLELPCGSLRALTNHLFTRTRSQPQAAAAARSSPAPPRAPRRRRATRACGRCWA